jgi:hypothetical protein
MADCRLCGARGLELVEIDDDQWELVHPLTMEAHTCREQLAITRRVMPTRDTEEEIDS